METLSLNSLTNFSNIKYFIRKFSAVLDFQFFSRRALSPYLISSMLCFSMLMPDPEVTDYRLEKAIRSALANNMSVSVAVALCVIGRADRQTASHHAHYCHFTHAFWLSP